MKLTCQSKLTFQIKASSAAQAQAKDKGYKVIYVTQHKFSKYP
jgi:hypothetical protein